MRRLAAMGRTVRLGEFLLGVEGLAILRNLLAGDPETIRARVDEILRMTKALDEPPLSLGIEVRDSELRAGYALWSRTYDSVPNPLIAVEEPVVRSLLREAPPGAALDAAAGTGRHAIWLRERGHRVVALDLTVEMLRQARAKDEALPIAAADLVRLPLRDACIDLAVCSLALSHCEDLAKPVGELSRVVRPGGHIVVSDIHPLALLLGGHALAIAADGSGTLIPDYVHSIQEYLEAFRGAGLEVVRCLEPPYDERAVDAFPGVALSREGFLAAYLGLPGALVWHLERR